MTVKIFVFWSVFITSVANVAIAQKVSRDTIVLYQLQLKNYAFCQCFSSVYRTNKDVLLQDGSLSAYFQTGHYEIQAYERIDSLAKIYSKRVYKNFDNHNLGMMKCLDFYNSQELKRTIIKLNKYLKR